MSATLSRRFDSDRLMCLDAFERQPGAFRGFRLSAWLGLAKLMDGMRRVKVESIKEVADAAGMHPRTLERVLEGLCQELDTNGLPLLLRDSRGSAGTRFTLLPTLLDVQSVYKRIDKTRRYRRQYADWLEDVLESRARKIKSGVGQTNAEKAERVRAIRTGTFTGVTDHAGERG